MEEEDSTGNRAVGRGKKKTNRRKRKQTPDATEDNNLKPDALIIVALQNISQSTKDEITNTNSKTTLEKDSTVDERGISTRGTENIGLEREHGRLV